MAVATIAGRYIRPKPKPVMMLHKRELIFHIVSDAVPVGSHDLLEVSCEAAESQPKSRDDGTYDADRPSTEPKKIILFLLDVVRTW